MDDEPTKENTWSSFSSFVKDGASKAKTKALEAKEKAANFANEVNENYNVSDKIETTKEQVGSFIDDKNEQYGVTKSIKKARETVDEYTPEELKKAIDTAGESLDVISGSKIMKDVEDMINLQQKYNDILATKLEEALQRIASLEAILNDKK